MLALTMWSISLSYAPTAEAAIGYATAEVGLNVRSGPSTNFSVLRSLSRGDTVTVLSRANSNWFHIRDSNGRTGYISSNSNFVSTRSINSSNTTSAAMERVIQSAVKYLGTPYEFGSNRSSTRTFDCSDFVRRVFYEGTGRILPGNSRSQAKHVRDLGNATRSWSQINRGDLVFFMEYRGTSKSNYTGIDILNQRITHVGIYLGDGRILHTYGAGGVRADQMRGTHWEYRMVFGGSAL